MTRPIFPDPVSLGLPPFPDKVSGPRGRGRPKGARNRNTLIMKDAMTAVFHDLQAETGKENGHMLAWARENPTEFYRLCGRMLPFELNARVEGPEFATVVFVRGEAELEALRETADE
jgi:hypothetical protein